MKARNAKSLSARCAGACPLGGVSTRARSAAGGECGKGSRLSAETREEKHKTRLESRKSPQVFADCSFSSKKSRIFLLEIAIIRNISFTFALDKTQLSLHPAALRRLYSAKSRYFSRPSGANAL